jgi:hypothetical protein
MPCVCIRPQSPLMPNSQTYLNEELSMLLYNTSRFDLVNSGLIARGAVEKQTAQAPGH